ncbi:hypothetical protein [Rhodococcus triatomae]|nr:hypothetical protein G419_05617 [Rhodococcus triatomae BKS 15-14]
MYRQFVIPDLDELSLYQQIDTAPVEGEPGVFALRASAQGGESLELVIDSLGRSVRLVISADGSQLLDVYRESATKLSIKETSDELIMTVSFAVDELAGELEMSIGRHVRVKDVLLLR